MVFTIYSVTLIQGKGEGKTQFNLKPAQGHCRQDSGDCTWEGGVIPANKVSVAESSKSHKLIGSMNIKC